MEPTKHTYTSP